MFTIVFGVLYDLAEGLALVPPLRLASLLLTLALLATVTLEKGRSLVAVSASGRALRGAIGHRAV